jgi:hypothetical protein
VRRVSWHDFEDIEFLIPEGTPLEVFWA